MIEFLSPVDVYVGERVRSTRQFRNHEISEVASAVGIPTSLLVAYEGGRKRFLREHLAVIADILNVRSRFFFEGLSKKAAQKRFLLPGPMVEGLAAANDDFAGVARRDPA